MRLDFLAVLCYGFFACEACACGGIGIRSRLRTYAVFGIPVQVRAGAQQSGDRVQSNDEDSSYKDSGGEEKRNSGA